MQCWIQSFRNAGHVTDGAGRRAFALVNRATGKALGRRRGDELVGVRLFPVLSGSINHYKKFTFHVYHRKFGKFFIILQQKFISLRTTPSIFPSDSSICRTDMWARSLLSILSVASPLQPTRSSPGRSSPPRTPAAELTPSRARRLSPPRARLSSTAGFLSSRRPYAPAAELTTTHARSSTRPGQSLRWPGRNSLRTRPRRSSTWTRGTNG